MTSLRLLMCDDEAEVGDFVRRVAEDVGYEMKFTDEAGDFGQLYRSFDPNLVILDLAMPNVDGIELLHLLAEEHCRAPILLMSGLDPSMRETALRLGRAYRLNMAGIVAKPIRAAELRELLDNLKTAAHLTRNSGTVAAVSGRLHDVRWRR
jgi:CheY-like chemotaxis protein